MSESVREGGEREREREEVKAHPTTDSHLVSSPAMSSYFSSPRATNL